MTYLLTRCEADHRRGLASALICVMCPRNCGHHKKLPTLMTIPRGSGANIGRNEPKNNELPTVRENLCQLLRWDYFKLSIGAIARLLVGSPSAKLGHVTEPVPLHVLVGDFHYQFGAQWLP